LRGRGHPIGPPVGNLKHGAASQQLSAGEALTKKTAPTGLRRARGAMKCRSARQGLRFGAMGGGHFGSARIQPSKLVVLGDRLRLRAPLRRDLEPGRKPETTLIMPSDFRRFLLSLASTRFRHESGKDHDGQLAGAEWQRDGQNIWRGLRKRAVVLEGGDNKALSRIVLPQGRRRVKRASREGSSRLILGNSELIEDPRGSTILIVPGG